MEGTINHGKRIQDQCAPPQGAGAGAFLSEETREKEVAEQIKEARSFGDLSENSEYDEAKNEQAKLYGRIAEVENILAHAVIIDETEDSEGKIGLGCTIKVEDMETGDEELYAIVGSQEANPMECRIPTIPRSARHCLATRSATLSRLRPPSACSSIRS